MNHVLARAKGHGKRTIFKLLSDTTIYDNHFPSQKACVEYSPDHNLDEDSWFKISDFSKQEFCIDLVKKDFVAAEYDDLPKEMFFKLSYLCAVQDGSFCFQKLTPSLFVAKKMIAFGEVATLEKSDRRLVVNSIPDAIYSKQSDVMVFKNLATVSSIFKGIDVLYKEATDDEVKSFFGQPLVEAEGDFDVSKVSKPNRKRIALAMDTLAGIPNDELGQMIGYVQEYCGGKLKIDAEAQKVKIANDDDLKLLLYGIEQRFYTTPFGKERRLANSVLSLD